MQSAPPSALTSDAVGEGVRSRRTCTMSQPTRDERVIITAPVGQDAEAMASALKREGFETQICQRLDECSRQMADSAGTVVLTEEALEAVQASRFLDVLRTQAPWSELPLIILTSGGESRRAELLDLAAAAAGTVTLLERPISSRTLMRSVQVALRSRRRQYQVRDLVRQLASLNQTLEQRVAQRTTEADGHGVVMGGTKTAYTFAPGTVNNLRADSIIKDHGDVRSEAVAYAVLCCTAGI